MDMMGMRPLQRRSNLSICCTSQPGKADLDMEVNESLIIQACNPEGASPIHMRQWDIPTLGLVSKHRVLHTYSFLKTLEAIQGRKKKLGRRPTCQTRMHTVLGFKLLMGRVCVCLFCSPHLPQTDTKELINSIVLLKPTPTLGSYCIFRNSSVFCLFPPPTQDCGVKSKF